MNTKIMMLTTALAVTMTTGAYATAGLTPQQVTVYNGLTAAEKQYYVGVLTNAQQQQAFLSMPESIRQQEIKVFNAEVAKNGLTPQQVNVYYTLNQEEKEFMKSVLTTAQGKQNFLNETEEKRQAQMKNYHNNQVRLP